MQREPTVLALIAPPEHPPERPETTEQSTKLIETVLAKLESWGRGFVEMLPNIAVALIVVVVFGLLARLAGKLVRKAAQRWSMQHTLAPLISTIVRLAIVGVGVIIALDILNLEKTVTSLLAGVGVVGLALGFAFQDIASNFMSGVIMGARKPLALGDMVETNDVFGTVHELSLRATQIETFSGQLALIPNKDVLQKPLINYTKLGRRRVDIACGVSYASDLVRAREVAIAAVEPLGDRDPSKPVELFYKGFGASSIDFELRFWLDLSQDPNYLRARSEAIIAIKQAFDGAGITIPFPIRTLDFGIEGGKELGEVAPGLKLTEPGGEERERERAS